MKKVNHVIEPFYNENSKVLILGTIPSPKSREAGFYYAHPQNRFWKVLSEILNETFPETIIQRKELLLKHSIALWDVLESCEIEGASDSSIKNPKPNNINKIINESDIKAIFTTGKKAETLYNKYCLEKTKFTCISLPSTSPANCQINYEKLKEEYKIILKYLN